MSVAAGSTTTPWVALANPCLKTTTAGVRSSLRRITREANPFDEPERGHTSDHIGRRGKRVAFEHRRKIDAPGARQHAAHEADEDQLADLTPMLKVRGRAGRRLAEGRCP